MTRYGEFTFGSNPSSLSTVMSAAFSGSPELLGQAEAHRLPDAVEAGFDYITPPTLVGQLSTDIPEDFSVGNLIIQVPPLATHLFVQAVDSFYGDNTDPDGDFAIRIRLLSAGDANGDSFVNVDDLLAVISAWGPCGSPPAACNADLNYDGHVNVDDLLIVIGDWGWARRYAQSWSASHVNQPAPRNQLAS